VGLLDTLELANFADRATPGGVGTLARIDRTMFAAVPGEAILLKP
jgi:hypothetical protein